MFELHSQLRQDGFSVGDFPLCHLLLINDVQYPWFVLVPRREDVTEVFQLDPADRHQLLEESCELAEAMKDAFAADKLNIAALGNMVSQLHVHHIARYRNDPAWPAPVWGKLPSQPYSDDQRRERLERLVAVLGSGFTPAEVSR
jgi:diadenosine tetraphosphate (Ap4A) HIT family hydrolase